MNEKGIFRTNSAKASSKVAINSFMIGALFFILTIIWTINPKQFNWVIMLQLVLAIPLLFVSSLTYSKIGYWKETKLWDKLGWFTHNLGNLLILNAVGLMTAVIYRNIAFIYFGLLILLMIAYSTINVIYRPGSFVEKLLKFLFFVIIIFIGGILPLL